MLVVFTRLIEVQSAGTQIMFEPGIVYDVAENHAQSLINGGSAVPATDVADAAYDETPRKKRQYTRRKLASSEDAPSILEPSEVQPETSIDPESGETETDESDTHNSANE